MNTDTTKINVEPVKPIWTSHVWHAGRCFFVSTIERTFDTSAGATRGQETKVWEYDLNKRESGEILYQSNSLWSGSIGDHARICHCLADIGLIPDEDDPRTARFLPS